LILRRNYITEKIQFEKVDLQDQELAMRTHAFRHSLINSKKSVHKEQAGYAADEL
jgi:hypothetical protein